MRLKAKANLILLLLCVLAYKGFTYYPEYQSYYPPTQQPDHVYLYSPGGFAGGEGGSTHYMMESLAGLLAKSKPRIFFNYDALQGRYRIELIAEGIVFETKSNPWEMVERFKDEFGSRYILYGQPGEDSVNVATSLAGPLGAIIIAQDIEPIAIAHGLTRILDVRGKDEQWCWEQYRGLFNRRILVHQHESRPRLRDYAVQLNAFTCYLPLGTEQDDPTHFTNRVLDWLEPDSVVLGWHETDEQGFVLPISARGSFVVAAGFDGNHSLLSGVEFPLAKLRMPHHTRLRDLVWEDDVHYATYLLTDGDNLSLMMWDAFVLNTLGDCFWTYPQRGTFNFGWTVTPQNLIPTAPVALSYLNKLALPTDGFVLGCLQGYMYPDRFGSHLMRFLGTMEPGAGETFTGNTTGGMNVQYSSALVKRGSRSLRLNTQDSGATRTFFVPSHNLNGFQVLHLQVLGDGSGATLRVKLGSNFVTTEVGHFYKDILIDWQGSWQEFIWRFPSDFSREGFPAIEDVDCLEFQVTGTSTLFLDDVYVSRTPYPYRNPISMHMSRFQSFMRKSGYNSIMVNAQDWNDTDWMEDGILCTDRLAGIFFTQYSDYAAGKGQIKWFKDSQGRQTPVVSARYKLWRGFETPESIAARLNASPYTGEPRTDSHYSVIMVHLWSDFDDTPDEYPYDRGLPPTHRSIALLNTDRVRVVKPEEMLLIMRLRRHPEEVIGEYLESLQEKMQELEQLSPPTTAAAAALEMAGVALNAATELFAIHSNREAFNQAQEADRLVEIARLSFLDLLPDGDAVRLICPAPTRPVFYFSLQEVEPDALPVQEYQLQFSETADFTVVTRDLTLRNDRVVLSDDFYVRIRAKGDQGDWGNWSRVIRRSLSATQWEVF